MDGRLGQQGRLIRDDGLSALVAWCCSRRGQPVLGAFLSGIRD
jgi:hypothetical protein